MLKSSKISKNFLARLIPEWDPGNSEKSNVELHSTHSSSIQCTVIPRKGRVFFDVQASIVNDNLPGSSYFLWD